MDLHGMFYGNLYLYVDLHLFIRRNLQAVLVIVIT